MILLTSPKDLVKTPSFGGEAAEVGEFTVSLIEESERSDRVFAVVSPNVSVQDSSVSNGSKNKVAGESPRKSSR